MTVRPRISWVAAVLLACGVSGGGTGPTANAFSYRGAYPAPALVAYTDQAGQGAQALAYPGQVRLFAKPAISAAAVGSLVKAAGGTILGQIPAFGEYLVGVPAGTESAFIAWAAANPQLERAFPNGPLRTADVVDLSHLEGPNGELPTMPNLKAQVGAGVYLYDPDDYVNATMECGAGSIAHGNATGYVSSASLSGTGQQINIFGVADTDVHPGDIAAANAIALEDMTFNGTGRAVVNLSLQGAYEDANHQPLTAAQYQNNEINLLWSYAHELNALAQTAPASFERTVFVIAAGNGVGDTGTSGLDLTSAIQQIRAQFPLVFPDGQGPHLIIVGGAAPGGSAADKGFNYSTAAGDIVYAPARSVQVSASGCTADGTSFAAPAVANLIARVLAANQSATVAQVTRAFMLAYAAKGQVLPTASEISAQLGGSSCSYALSPSSRSFDPAGGSGSIAVTTTSGCAWIATTGSGWITVTAGASGSGSGTVSFSVAANGASTPRTGGLVVGGQPFTVTQAGAAAASGVTGTWSGTLSMPSGNYLGCDAQTVSFSLSLTESAGAVTGSTSNSRTITSGSRSGNSITVSLSTMFGGRGPYTWTWNGANTITGSMAYFCYDLSSGGLQSEGTESFSVTRQ